MRSSMRCCVKREYLRSDCSELTRLLLRQRRALGWGRRSKGEGQERSIVVQFAASLLRRPPRLTPRPFESRSQVAGLPSVQTRNERRLLRGARCDYGNSRAAARNGFAHGAGLQRPILRCAGTG